MQFRSLYLSLLAVVLGTAASHGASQSIVMNMTLVYQANSNPAKTAILRLNNAALIKAAIAASGSSATLKSTDCDIVIDESSRFIDVITKADSKFFYRLGRTGTDATGYGNTDTDMNKGVYYNAAVSDYEFTLPAPILTGTGSSMAVCMLLTRSFELSSAPGVVKTSGVFTGGSTEAANVSFDVTGSFAVGKKSYSVVDDPSTP